MKLTAKEEEVMEYIWQLTNGAGAEDNPDCNIPCKEEEGDSPLGECTPKEVRQLYPEPRPLINGIQNAFQSLERKGYLTHRQQGRGYIYRPIVEKKEYGRGKLGAFVDKYFDGSCLSVVSQFVNEERLTETELMQFLADLMKRNSDK